MTNFFGSRIFAAICGGIAVIAVAGIAVVALTGYPSGSAAAAPASPTASGQPTKAPPSLVALAIGQLHETDGGQVTVDLHAEVRAGNAGGNFRFFSADDGYYNGGVASLTFQNGVITAKGGGGLFKDGHRTAVQYIAVFNTSTKHAEITVRKKDGSTYTMTGTVDGLVWAGPPPVQAGS